MRNQLKIKRWESGIKQYELAILLGCSSTYLSMVENGRIEPTEQFKSKAAEIFNTTVEELFSPTTRFRVPEAAVFSANLNE
ncbi:MAG: helix-turn-helix transcriptional regulator [candidate division KSB1 bacterium]|nr:helix-turn-helix transcriptional regulator [candidate division KSB1 bacterium]MDZ7346106.1 helix-turn-helix transcriptional regulator [candidate division KSB1 bacterium]MDZ7370286.1 helix-turn-helix transcriptional regulator [candidate division KSB1 bacterium]